MKRRTQRALDRLEVESQNHMARAIETLEQKTIEEIAQMTRDRIEANGSPLEGEPSKAAMAWTYFRELNLQAIAPLEEHAMAILSATLKKGKYGIFNIAELLNGFTHTKHSQLSHAGQNYKALVEKFELTHEDEVELYAECFDHTHMAILLEDLATKSRNNEIPDTATLVRLLLTKLAEMYAAKHIETQFSKKTPFITVK